MLGVGRLDPRRALVPPAARSHRGPRRLRPCPTRQRLGASRRRQPRARLLSMLGVERGFYHRHDGGRKSLGGPALECASRGQSRATKYKSRDNCLRVASAIPESMHFALCTAYFAVLLVLAMYGLHRSPPRAHRACATARALRELEGGRARAARRGHRRPRRPPVRDPAAPLYNEATVADAPARARRRDRVPARAARDPGARRLDRRDARPRARARSRALRERGLDVVYIHRVDRTGYKAGALDNGLKVAKGELVAIFDADFLPQPDFLRAVVPHFMQRPEGRHGAGALGPPEPRALAAHAHAGADARRAPPRREPRARRRPGWLFNFSGTGGIWRKEAIASRRRLAARHAHRGPRPLATAPSSPAGGSSTARTSSRPPSCPEDISAFRAQQFRWAKGTVQTARKLMGAS